MEEFVKKMVKEHYRESWFRELWKFSIKSQNFNNEAKEFYNVLNAEFARLVDIDYRKAFANSKEVKGASV